VRIAFREGGFGSTLNALVKPTLHALLHNKVPLSAQLGEHEGSRAFHRSYNLFRAQPLDLFRNKSKCESESLECFLEPLSNCSDELRLQRPALMLGGRFLEVASNEHIYHSFRPAARPLLELMERAGHFNTVSLLLAHLIRPSAAVYTRLARAKRLLGWPDLSPSAAHAAPRRARPLLIGVHLRAGDACAREALGRHNRSCEPLSAYLPAIRRLERAYGGQRPVYVYLATDDEAAAAEARAMGHAAGGGRAEQRAAGGRGGGQDASNVDSRSGAADGRGVGEGGGSGSGGVRGGATWLTLPDDEVRRKWARPKLSHGRVGDILQVEVMLHMRLSDGYEDAMTVLVDLLLLAECDALVGKFSSNIDRIAYSMMAARRGAELARGRGREQGSASAGVGAGAAAAPTPKLCLPPYVSLDHPWCADFGSWMPLRSPVPTPYPGASSPGTDGRPLIIGGFQC
jgi:hypothetical protein